jgi:hypothetical protein
MDGWALQDKAGGVMLLRRNVPVSDQYYADIYLDPSTKNTVGILSSNKPIKGQVLVDPNGRPVAKGKVVAVPSWKPVDKEATVVSRDHSLTDEENRQLLMAFVGIVAASVIMRVVFDMAALAYVFAFPLLYLYLVYTCPPPESFDAKKEIKRVLRGYHLPANDPNKPKGFFAETLARAQASVATEIATMPGYEVMLMPLAGAFVVAGAKVPTAGMEYFWLGANYRWLYVYARKLDSATD